MTDLAPLRQSALFKDMTDTEIKELEECFTEKSLPEGMTVFVENMTGESLYLIGQGAIKISKMLAEGDEKTLVILGPEEIFGETAVLDSAPRAATARVAENARLLRLRRADYESLCDRNPRLALRLTRNIVRVFSQRIRESNEEYMEMLLWSLGEPR